MQPKANISTLLRVAQAVAEYKYFAEPGDISEETLTNAVYSYLCRCQGMDESRVHKFYGPQEWKNRGATNSKLDLAITAPSGVSSIFELKYIRPGSDSISASNMMSEIVMDILRLMSLKEDMKTGGRRFLVVVGDRQNFDRVWESDRGRLGSMLSLDGDKVSLFGKMRLFTGAAKPYRRIAFTDEADKNGIEKIAGNIIKKNSRSIWNLIDKDAIEDAHTQLISTNCEDFSNTEDPIFDARIWEVRLAKSGFISAKANNNKRMDL